MKKITISIILISIFFPLITLASEVTVSRKIDNQKTIYNLEFKSGNYPINVIEGTLVVPKNIEVVKIDTKISPVSVWTIAPTYNISDRTISFSGGVIGSIPNNTKIILFNIQTKNTENDQNNIQIKSINAYINDGKGTLDKIDISKFISGESVSLQQKNNIKTEIGSDPSMFDGKKFLFIYGGNNNVNFSHYEIKEGIFGKYIKVENYYILKNNNPPYYINVKSVDDSGNTISEVSVYPHGKSVYLFIFGIIVLILFIILYFLKKKINGNKNI